MLEGMLLAIVIVALAQLPWLVWLSVRERPEPGGGGGGSKRGQGPPLSPLEPSFDWDSFEDDFHSFAWAERQRTLREQSEPAATTGQGIDARPDGDALSG
jgi:hypothetical protein